MSISNTNHHKINQEKPSTQPPTIHISEFHRNRIFLITTITTTSTMGKQISFGESARGRTAGLAGMTNRRRACQPGPLCCTTKAAKSATLAHELQCDGATITRRDNFRRHCAASRRSSTRARLKAGRSAILFDGVDDLCKLKMVVVDCLVVL